MTSASLNRHRAFTLFLRAYEEVRAALAFLRRNYSTCWAVSGRGARTADLSVRVRRPDFFLPLLVVQGNGPTLTPRAWSRAPIATSP